MGRLADEERAAAAATPGADGEPRDEVDELVAAWRAQHVFPRSRQSSG